MHLRKLSTTLAILAATAGVSAFTASAHAADVDNDPVSSLVADEASFTEGNIAFNFSDGLVTPEVTGTLRAFDADSACVRVRVHYYDSNDTELTSKPGAKLCPTDEDTHHATVDLKPYSDAAINGVRVEIEEEGATNVWSTQAESIEYYLTTHPDHVLIEGNGVDVGTGGLSGGTPADDATVSWKIADGQVTPTFAGDLYLNKMGIACARVKLRYLAEDGTQLAHRESDPPTCSNDNGFYDDSLTLDDFTSPSVAKVEVIPQTEGLDGSWSKPSDMKSVTVSIEDSGPAI